MQKEPKSIIISKLRERGCRITRQRRIILDIILDEDCSCCKEIYYKACKQDSSIGAATVYRMVNTLEEIGVISRKNMYKFTDSDGDDKSKNCKTQIQHQCSVISFFETFYFLCAKILGYIR